MKEIFSIIICLFSINIQSQKINNDSLLKANITEVVEELKFMYETDQYFRKLTESNKFTNSLNSRINNNYVLYFDDIHTKRLMEICKIYGFPSKNRLEKLSGVIFEDEFNPYLILVHSRKKNFEEIREIITTERKNKNINKCEFGHILWHINGRKNLKDFTENGYQFSVDENGKQKLKATNCED